MSFKIKSSHKYSNPVQEADTEPNYTLETHKTDKEVVNVPKTTTDTEVVSGSSNGMAVRTSITAMADYF